MLLAEIGTDSGRLDSWNKSAAIAANKAVRDMGLERKGLVEETLTGYLIPFLDGIWLRAPYLHNGSVPTLRDLLTPAAERPSVFYRGYDVYDPVNAGFIVQGEDAQRIGSKQEANRKGNSNRGHEYGTTLPATDKEALIEYLKML
jgi:hypothetical protein